MAPSLLAALSLFWIPLTVIAWILFAPRGGGSPYDGMDFVRNSALAGVLVAVLAFIRAPNWLHRIVVTIALAILFFALHFSVGVRF